MSSTTHEPKVLYSINNVNAFHIHDGDEQPLTPSGPQTLSLLMVSTSTSFPDPENLTPAPEAPEDDFYLHLHLPPELDLSLPATTQIFRQPPNSYLIPRWDLGPDAGAFVRIEFPSIGTGPSQVTQEDVDTFEAILAQCTAFLERAPAPAGHAPYNPADYDPGEGYISSETKPEQSGGKIVLVDEEDGSVIGELADGYEIKEKPGVRPGSKNPVEIQLPVEGETNEITIDNAPEEYLRLARHPAYKASTIVQTSATASRLIVTGSSYLANALTSGADHFTRKTKPKPKPLTFSETTQRRIRKINNLSQGALTLSAMTANSVGRVAQNFGSTLARRKDVEQQKGFGKPANSQPGILNKSMIAFSTLADGIEQGARTIMQSGTAAASTMISHRYGPEAGLFASEFTRGFKNVGLVYIDVTGVSRRAIFKSVAKGMVVGRMKDGKQVVVAGGDGFPGVSDKADAQSSSPPRPRDSSARRPSPNRTPPPAYGELGTYSLGFSSMPGAKQ